MFRSFLLVAALLSPYSANAGQSNERQCLIVRASMFCAAQQCQSQSRSCVLECVKRKVGGSLSNQEITSAKCQLSFQ